MQVNPVSSNIVSGCLPLLCPRGAAESWQGGPEYYVPKVCAGHRLVAIGNNAGRQSLLRQDIDVLWQTLPQRLPVTLMGDDCPWAWVNTGGRGRTMELACCLCGLKVW